MHHGCVGPLIPESFGPDARLLPILIEGAFRPLLEEVRLVVGRKGDRRAPGPPRHLTEPLMYVDRCHGRGTVRIRSDLRADQCVAICPRRLLQLERAALADAALV